jgi:hypothetical protein
MKSMIALSCVALSFIVISGAAEAKGCLTGALVGGVAGHYAGHHGLVGAAAGCWIARHEARKHELERERPARQGDRDYRDYPEHRTEYR